MRQLLDFDLFRKLNFDLFEICFEFSVLARILSRIQHPILPDKVTIDDLECNQIQIAGSILIQSHWHHITTGNIVLDLQEK